MKRYGIPSSAFHAGKESIANDGILRTKGDDQAPHELRLSGRFHKYGYESEDPSPTLPVDGEGELPPVNGGIKRGVLWGRPIRSVKAGHPQHVTVFRKRNTKPDPLLYPVPHTKIRVYGRSFSVSARFLISSSS